MASCGVALWFLQHLDSIFVTCGQADDLYVAIKEFHEIIYSKHSESMEQWLNKLGKFDIPELQTYVNGVK